MNGGGGGGSLDGILKGRLRDEDFPVQDRRAEHISEGKSRAKSLRPFIRAEMSRNLRPPYF